jgi:hypothetical protein
MNKISLLKLLMLICFQNCLSQTVATRDKKDFIKKELHNEIINYLNRITEKKTDSTKIIIINYHPGKDKCNSTGDQLYVNSLYRDYLDVINSKKNVSQYFIYKDVDGTSSYYKRIKWYHDIDKVIENNFFPRHYPCGSYLIIYPNGKYFVQYGEYYIKSIFEKI